MSLADVLVPVEIGSSYADKNCEKKLATFDSYLSLLDALESNREETRRHLAGQPQIYLAQHDLREEVPTIEDDIVFPHLISTIGKGDVLRTNFWIGPPKCFSPLHRDPFHNFFVQV